MTDHATELGFIKSFLRSVHRRWLLYTSGRWILSSAGLLLGVFWLLVVVEQLRGLSVAARVGLWLALVLISGFGLILLLRAWFGPVPDRKRALDLERYAPDLREQLITAVDVGENPETQRLGYSSWLYEHTVDQAERGLKKIDLGRFWSGAGLIRGLRWFGVGAALSLILGLLFPTASERTLFAVTHPTEEIPRPAPFEWVIDTEIDRVLQYEDATVRARAEGSRPPESARLLWRYGNEGEWFDEVLRPENGRDFSHTLTALPQSVSYRFEADGRISSKQMVFVARRPELTAIEATCLPPAYTRVDPFALPATEQRWIVPDGSRIALAILSDRPLVSGRIVFADSSQTPLTVAETRASAEWRVNLRQTLRVFVVDTSGYDNFDPVPIEIETIPDLPPQIAILEPGADRDIPEAMTVRLAAALLDDYGLSRLEVVYKVVGEGGEREEKTLPVSLPSDFGREGVFPFNWSVMDLRLFPGDRVMYRLRVHDNRSPKPQWAESKTYVLRLPTLDEIIAETERDQGRRTDRLSDAVKEQHQLSEDLRDMARELVGKPNVEWEDRQQLEQAQALQQELAQNLEEWAEEIEDEAEKLAQNRLATLEMVQKMNEVARLLEEVMTPELREAMEKLREAMEAMSPEEMRQALEDFQMNQEEILAQLDRTLAQLRQLQLEQMMENMLRLAERLAENQEQQNQATADAPDQRTLDSLAREEQALRSELSELQKQAQELAEKSQEFEGRPEIEEFAQTAGQCKAGADMENMAHQMQSGSKSQAGASGEAAQQKLRQMLADMQNQLMQMRNQMDAEQLLALQGLTRRALELSEEQERLGDSTAALSRQSLALRDLARQQMGMIESIDMLMADFDLQARDNLFLSPDVRRHLRSSRNNAGSASQTLNQRNGPAAQGQQYEAMFSLNEATKSLMESMQNQGQCQGSSPGQGQMQSGMQQLSQQQQQLNQQSQGMQNPFGLSPAEQASVERLSAQQQSIQRQMQDLADRFEQSRDRLGRLDEMARSMDEVIEGLNQGEVTDATLERQRNIYNRMLDFQKSLQRQDFENRRQSQRGIDLARRVPDPLDLSRRRTADDAARWEQFQNEWYPPGFRALVKEYFETVTQRAAEQE